MPPKSKKPPPPELTPEEKLALKLAKKEEKRLEQIEIEKQQKRDHLRREIRYGDMTMKKHEKSWRQMLINLALPKMREDLEFAWHNFERVIDCKDFTISLLMDEIKDSEEQYMVNNRTHVEHIDKLIDLFHEKIEEFEEDYVEDITKLLKRGEDDIQELQLTALEEENYIKTMLHILDIARKEQKQNIRADYFSKLGEAGKRANFIISTLKGTLENMFQSIMKTTVKFLNHYENKTKLRRKEHDELKLQDENLQQLLVVQLEKIRTLCEYLKILKMKLNDSEKALRRKLRDAENEQDFFAFAFSTLKKRLKVDMKKDVQQLIYLTVNYNSTVEHLEKLRDKAAGILNISAVCRKLETEQEKIRPFPMNDEKEKEEAPPVEESEENENKEYLPSMEMFWQRVAQVEASRFALAEEKKYLQTENELLKLKLYQYCQCLSCPEPKRDIVKQSIKHITEGTLEKQKYDKQNVLQFSSSRSHHDIDA